MLKAAVTRFLRDAFVLSRLTACRAVCPILIVIGAIIRSFIVSPQSGCFAAKIAGAIGLPAS